MCVGGWFAGNACVFLTCFETVSSGGVIMLDAQGGCEGRIGRSWTWSLRCELCLHCRFYIYMYVEDKRWGEEGGLEEVHLKCPLAPLFKKN